MRGRGFSGEEGAQFADGAHQGRREHDGGVLVDADLDQALQVAQLQCEGVGHHDVGGAAQGVGGQGLAFGGDDFGTLFPFGLGLAGHRPFHAVGQLDVLELDQGDHHAPLLGRHVEDFADVDVDAVGLGQRLVEGVLPDHLAQGGLGDLVDGRPDVFDGHHRLDRVDDAVVGDGGDVDADVVAGDDALGLDGHGDDAQADPVQDVDDRDDDGQAGLSDPDDASEPEQDSLLVLFDDLDGEGEQQQRQHDDNYHDPHIWHGASFPGASRGDADQHHVAGCPRRLDDGCWASSAPPWEFHAERVRLVLDRVRWDASASDGPSATGVPSDTSTLRLSAGPSGDSDPSDERTSTVPAAGRRSIARRGGGAFGHLLRGDVFDVGGDTPSVSERVLELSGAIAVELVLDGAQGSGAGVDCPRKDVVDILDVDTYRDRRAADGLRCPDAQVRVLVRKHDQGGPDLELGVADRAVGLGHSHP